MLIITGSIAYDYIMNFPGVFSDHILPEKIHNINLSFIVNKFERRRGGTAGNVSYTLALLNTPHTLFSVAGKDFSEYKKVFTNLGVNMKNVKINKDTYTATGFAMTDHTNNQIWGFFYGAAEYSTELELKKIAKKNDLVLVGPQGAKGSLGFVKQCVKSKLSYIFDPGFILTQVSNEDLGYGVENAKYIMGNDYEIDSIQKRVKEFNSMKKNKIIVTTLGEKGLFIENEGKIIKIKAAKPKKVTDPTGAGDALRAGFLAGIERNYDLETCGQIGAVAASFAIEEYGTQEHQFTKQEFTKRYKLTYNKEIII